MLLKFYINSFSLFSPITFKVPKTIIIERDIAEKSILSDCSNSDRILAMLSTSSKNVI